MFTYYLAMSSVVALFWLIISSVFGHSARYTGGPQPIFGVGHGGHERRGTDSDTLFLREGAGLPWALVSNLSPLLVLLFLVMCP